MQSVGTRIREERLKQGQTLEDISAKTRISLKNLRAIEADQLEELSSPFFYKSFVRQYVTELGLEYEQFATAVQDAAGTMPEPLIPGQGLHEPVRIPPLPHIAKGEFRWVFPAAGLVVLVMACSGLYTTFRHFRPKWQHLTAAAVSTAVSRAPAATADKKVDNHPSAPSDASGRDSAMHPSATHQRKLTPAQEPETTSQPDTAFHLELSAIERTWLSIAADGKAAYSGILEPDESKAFDVRESAKLRTGNAGGINVSFNGKLIGTLGPRGTTRTIVFTRSGYEVVQPARIAFTVFNPNGEPALLR